MLKRTRRTLWIVAAVLLVLAAAIYLRFKAPPEAARLLPESDGIVYVNLRPLRAVLKKKPVVRAPEYQTFVDATGIDWERDLDEVAVSLHRMSNPNGPNGPVAYSMVLEGKVDGKRLASYLDAHSAGKENYDGQTVYSLPSEGRTVRVVQIGYDMIAISNAPSRSTQFSTGTGAQRFPSPGPRCWLSTILKCPCSQSHGGWGRSVFLSAKAANCGSWVWTCLWLPIQPSWPRYIGQGRSNCG